MGEVTVRLQRKRAAGPGQGRRSGHHHGQRQGLHQRPEPAGVPEEPPAAGSGGAVKEEDTKSRRSKIRVHKCQAEFQTPCIVNHVFDRIRDGRASQNRMPLLKRSSHRQLPTRSRDVRDAVRARGSARCPR
ncbi:MAG: hypothetical protein MZV70_08335 [Desulfobacterales bacterium]|nr:hypothetical protein [Desulfobacterales bacterium]